MSKAYLVGQITVTNSQAYAVYSAQVPQTIAAFGGKYLVRGGHATQTRSCAAVGRLVAWTCYVDARGSGWGQLTRPRKVPGAPTKLSLVAIVGET